MSGSRISDYLQFRSYGSATPHVKNSIVRTKGMNGSRGDDVVTCTHFSPRRRREDKQLDPLKNPSLVRRRNARRRFMTRRTRRLMKIHAQNALSVIEEDTVTMINDTPHVETDEEHEWIHVPVPYPSLYTRIIGWFWRTSYSSGEKPTDVSPASIASATTTPPTNPVASTAVSYGTPCTTTG